MYSLRKQDQRTICTMPTVWSKHSPKALYITQAKQGITTHHNNPPQTLNATATDTHTILLTNAFPCTRQYFARHHGIHSFTTYYTLLHPMEYIVSPHGIHCPTSRNTLSAYPQGDNVLISLILQTPTTHNSLYTQHDRSLRHMTKNLPP